jgi:integrase
VSPADRARPPRQRPYEIHPPEPAQVQLLRREAEAVNLALPVFLRLAATTGARRSELIALRWGDLDLDARRLTIARAIVEDFERSLVEKGTKTHSSRRVALDPVTVDLLRAHWERAADLAAQCDVVLHAKSFVFSHDPASRDPWRPDYATHAFRVLARRLGMPELRLHDLRHYVATRLLANGTDVRTVAGRLGHRNASTTLNVYAHFVPAADEDAADLLGDVLVAELHEGGPGDDDAPPESDGP